MQIERAAAIREVLSIESNESKAVGVIDDRVRHVLQIESRSAPSLTEIPIFSRREREAFVEAAQLHELGAR